MTVDEMKKKIQELQDELDEAEDNAEKAKANSADTATLAAAEEKVKKLTAELKTATDEVKGLAESQAKEISELKGQVKSLTSQIGDMSETRRKERVKQKVDAVPIPALRRFIEPLYHHASSTAKTATYSAKEGEAAKDTPVEAILDDMIGFLKSEAVKLFSELSATNLQERGEGDDINNYGGDPSKEAEKRAREHMDKSGEKKFSKAVAHVINADPKLGKAYADFTTGRPKH